MRQQVCQLKIIGKICSPDVSCLWNQRIFRCISIFKCAIESKFKFKFITTLFLLYLFDSLPEIPFDDHNSNWNLLLIKLNQIKFLQNLFRAMINVPKETRGTIRELRYFKDISRQSGNLKQSRILCQQSFLQKKLCKSKDIENRFQCHKTDPSGNN